MKIMITGAGGMLGRELNSILAPVPRWQIHAYTHAELDVEDQLAVQSAVSSCKPEVLLHLAAYTDVERGEKEPDTVCRTNYLGTWYVCQACAMENVTMVYLSSDLVFDGKKGQAYVETDSPNPLNVYGHSKLAGENLVRELLPRHYIIRAGWMFGSMGQDHKFAGKILERARAGQPLQVVMDRIGSPIYTCDLAGKIRDMLKENYPWGTYHVVNKGLCSRHEFASQILRYAGLDGVEIAPVASASMGGDVPRPVVSALHNYALELMGRNNMRTWEEALEEYMREILRPEKRNA